MRALRELTGRPAPPVRRARVAIVAGVPLLNANATSRRFGQLLKSGWRCNVRVISRPEFAMLLLPITSGGLLLMMGRHSRAESLFYYFRLEDQIPEDHLLRLIDRHVMTCPRSSRTESYDTFRFENTSPSYHRTDIVSSRARLQAHGPCGRIVATHLSACLPPLY